MLNAKRPTAHGNRLVFKRILSLAFCLVISLIGCRRSDSVNTDPAQEDTSASLTPEDAALNEDKQKHIWLTEHVTFELEHKFGSALTKAIRSVDANVVDNFLLSSAMGTLPEFDLSSFEQTGISEVTCSDTRIEASRDEILQAIVNIPAEFDSIDSGKIRVLSIRGPSSEDAEWMSSFLLTLSGQRQGEATYHESVHQISFEVDEPKEIGQTPFISEWIIADIIMRRSGSRLFREATSHYALDRLPLGDNWKLEPAATLQYRFQTAVADFNQDGFPDIVIADYTGERILLASVEGQSFRRVDQQLGIRNCWPERYAALAAWIDYDNDGFPDLLLGKSVYHNEQGKRFRDVTLSTNITLNRDPNGAAVADFDVDGDLDLYVVYQHPNTKASPDDGKSTPWIGDDDSGAVNQLWRNNNDGTFTEVADQTGATAGKRKSFAANWLYYDSDYPAGVFEQIKGSCAGNRLYSRHLSESGNSHEFAAFENSAELGINDIGWAYGSAMTDFDGNGWADIYAATGFSSRDRGKPDG